MFVFVPAQLIDGSQHFLPSWLIAKLVPLSTILFASLLFLLHHHWVQGRHAQAHAQTCNCHVWKGSYR